MLLIYSCCRIHELKFFKNASEFTWFIINHAKKNLFLTQQFSNQRHARAIPLFIPTVNTGLVWFFGPLSNSVSSCVDQAEEEVWSSRRRLPGRSRSCVEFHVALLRQWMVTRLLQVLWPQIFIRFIVTWGISMSYTVRDINPHAHGISSLAGVLVIATISFIVVLTPPCPFAIHHPEVAKQLLWRSAELDVATKSYGLWCACSQHVVVPFPVSLRAGFKSMINSSLY